MSTHKKYKPYKPRTWNVRTIEQIEEMFGGEWTLVSGFSNYAISRDGRVVNRRNPIRMIKSYLENGFLNVGLYDDYGVQLKTRLQRLYNLSWGLPYKRGDSKPGELVTI